MGHYFCRKSIPAAKVLTKKKHFYSGALSPLRETVQKCVSYQGQPLNQVEK